MFSFLSLFLLFGANAQSLLLEENFDYSQGELLTNHGWTAHSGVGNNSIAIVSPGLTFNGYA